MSDDEQAIDNVEEEEDDGKPWFNLFIKASAIDKENTGSCPICQQWFMVAHLLAQSNNCGFKVFTVPLECPPKSFTDITTSRVFPIVQGVRGRNVNGSDIAGLVADSYDEVEKFFEEINRDCIELKRTWAPNQKALKVIQDIYKHFNSLLINKDKAALLGKDLRNLNNYLEEVGGPFLTGDDLSYADCFLLPRLQHILVAGNYYRDFEVEDGLPEVWKYLENGYNEISFDKTLPTDRDIINHYSKKCKPSSNKPNPHLMSKNCTKAQPKQKASDGINSAGDHEDDH